MNTKELKKRWNQALDRLGMRLADMDSLPLLSLLALLAGCLSGAVIVAFRLLIESNQASILPGNMVENYEGLSPLYRFLLPTGGGLMIGLIWHFLSTEIRQVGVVHVMERMAYHQARLPWRNGVAQFFGAALSIISGHSVGREGPSVHLGATSGSQLGKWLRLPNNSIRTLVACGVAAAIAASFNTPLAGVIFAMEVVMMEYTLAGFAPVILAAVSATTVTRAVFGHAPVFYIPNLQLGSLLELPYVVLMGLVLGVMAALFTHLLQKITPALPDWPIWTRLTLGGAIVGVCGLFVPEIMGIGYDTVDKALLGQIGLVSLITIATVKLCATAACLGLGLPGGLIGPTFFIGAATGGAMGLIAANWMPGEVASPSFYALIGMGTMMGATLQAPLAALTAMLEMTANPNIILPGMLALITAGLVSREVFGKESVYLELMRVRGLDYRNDPVMQALRRIGVASAMERRFTTLPQIAGITEARESLIDKPRWILIQEPSGARHLMQAADLARFLQDAETDSDSIDLADIPAKRQQVTPIDFQASLQEALAKLDDSEAEALYVVRQTVPGIERVYGILVREDIESSYRL